MPVRRFSLWDLPPPEPEQSRSCKSADQQLWSRAFETDDSFGDVPGARLAKATQQQYFFGWRRYLGFVAAEEPSALEIAAAERLTMERVRRFAVHLAATNAPQSVAGCVDALYKAARIMLPEHDWAWLRSAKARLHAAAPARSPKGPVITSVQLLELGQQLMDESQMESATSIPMAEAVKYRDGLMIALLAFIPLRRKNFSALEIGRHLVEEGSGWFIIVPPEETKTGTSIEFPVPEMLTPYLATYLHIIRPRMLTNTMCKALWVSPKGGALLYSGIWGIMTRHTMRRLVFALLRMTPATRPRQPGPWRPQVKSASHAISLATVI
jgi:integrase/recombinase XerD